MFFKKLAQHVMVILISILSATTIQANTVTDPNSEMINQVINRFMEKNNVPGVAVELYVDGKPSEYYYGYTNKDKKTPITKDTIFEIGSISKVMACLLLAQQLDAAKMDLDNSVTEYLKELPDTFDEITLINLATHTSGLPLEWPETVKTTADLKQQYATWKATYPTDEVWLYSSVGIGLLGDALQQFQHKSLEELFQKKLFAPLGMSQFAFTVPVNHKQLIAQGYNETDNPVPLEQINYYPAGYGVKAAAKDMKRFLAAAIGLSGTPVGILYPMRMTQAAYLSLPDRQQGLGWDIHSLAEEEIAKLLEVSEFDLGPTMVSEMYERHKYDGDALIDKTGMTQGFRSYIAVIPKKQTGIVILVNKNVKHQEIVGVARELLFKLNNIKPPASKQPE